MRKIIADSGPLISLFDSSESKHAVIRGFFADFDGTAVTTWPVMTEVSHMLGYSVERQLAFLRWAERGGLEVVESTPDILLSLLQLMEKYRDRPMDLADASLIALSIQTGIRDIITFDSDFDFYRLPDRTKMKNLLAKTRRN